MELGGAEEGVRWYESWLRIVLVDSLEGVQNKEEAVDRFFEILRRKVLENSDLSIATSLIVLEKI